MADFYMTGAGDLTLTPNGDIAQTDSTWREDMQQAYIRVMTEIGDFVLYPELGSDMSRMYGMPQSEATAEYGKQLIKAALDRENRFAGKPVTITAVPTGPQSIRFDIYITSCSRERLLLSVQQNLGINSIEG